MLIFFALHLVIVASPLYPHSRLSWICAWTSSFVHGVPFVFTVSPTLLKSNTTRAARAAQGCTEDVRMGAGDKTHE